MFPDYQPPAEYTGEAFGVGYLYQQTGKVLSDSKDDDLDKAIDEGFEDYCDCDPYALPLPHPDDSVSLATVTPPDNTNESDEEEEVEY